MTDFKMLGVYSVQNQESIAFRNHNLVRCGATAVLPCCFGGICHCLFSGKIESHECD